MGTYAVTGSASGIGAAVVRKLQQLGHQVITVDLRNADLNVDLSTADGRRSAIEGILQAAPAGLDGFIPCAGVGPQTRPLAVIPKINFFGTVVLVEALKASLLQKRGSIVLISSNSATLMPYNAEYLQVLAQGDEAAAAERIATLDGQTAYGGSKFALTCWMRQRNADYARSGIRMNAIAPGYTETALTQAGQRDPMYGPAIKAFVESIPLGRPGQPDDQAEAVAFLLSPQAAFISGAVLFVDGGHDAMFRPEHF